MPDNFSADSPADAYRELFEQISGDVYVVARTEQAISGLIESLAGGDQRPDKVHLMADSRRFKGQMDDFLLASEAAELAEEDLLETREAPDNVDSVITDGETVAAPITFGRGFGIVTGSGNEMAASLLEELQDFWQSSEAASLPIRTPPRTKVSQTMSQDIGEAASQKFDQALQAVDTARGDAQQGDLDEVTISILVAAQDGEMFYDLSRWGEDAGVASKATFSRVKNKLEDVGLIETEKVPIDVGRPRQRLKLADERLKDADPDQLVSAADTVLN